MAQITAQEFSAKFQSKKEVSTISQISFLYSIKITFLFWSGPYLRTVRKIAYIGNEFRPDR